MHIVLFHIRMSLVELISACEIFKPVHCGVMFHRQFSQMAPHAYMRQIAPHISTSALNVVHLLCTCIYTCCGFYCYKASCFDQSIVY